ncbi:hypothetical protein [Chryseobacterium wanjuense]
MIPIFLYSLSIAQVGINTTSPNGATVLDIFSNQKGILIPRLSDADRNTNLADNDPLTVPPAGVANASLANGTLIFNTTSNTFQYWDGSLWRQLFVTTSSQAGNDGVVKVNSGNANVKPSLNLSASGSGYSQNNRFCMPYHSFLRRVLQRADRNYGSLFPA